jgi:hypothetical protein
LRGDTVESERDDLAFSWLRDWSIFILCTVAAEFD